MRATDARRVEFRRLSYSGEPILCPDRNLSARTTRHAIARTRRLANSLETAGPVAGLVAFAFLASSWSPSCACRPSDSFLLVLGGSCLATGTLLGCGGTTTSPAETTGKDSGSPSIVLPIDFDATARSDAGPDGSLSHDAGHDTAPPGVDAPPPPTDAELNTYPSFVPDVPQVQSNGGQVLANPVFVPIIFPNDTYAAQIPPFMNAIGQSQYWKTAVSEYGVGAGTAVAPIILDETMPTTIDDSQLQVWLTNRIGLDPRFGALPGSDIADAGPFDAGVIDANAPVSSAISPTVNAPVNAIYTLFLPEGDDRHAPGLGELLELRRLPQQLLLRPQRGATSRTPWSRAARA